MTVQQFITDWSKYPPLPENAADLIRAEVERKRESLISSNFGDVDESIRVQKDRDSRQQFAVFGLTAYEIISMIVQKDGKHFGWRPALLNGAAYRSIPNEGRDGTLHWAWMEKKQKWYLTWLDQTPSEIISNIAEEIDAGETPLTGFDNRQEYQ